VEQHDIQRPEPVACPVQGPLQVGDGDESARRLVADVEHDGWRQAPLQRHLVDGARRLTLAGRAVVVGGIDVGARVRDRPHLLDRPAQPAGVDEVLWLHAEEVTHLPQALSVVAVVADLRGQRLAGGVMLQWHAQVDQAVSGQYFTLLSGIRCRRSVAPLPIARCRG
jgi:hypothetical protein